MDVSRLLLCSTDDENTVNTWKHLGFRVTSPEELQSWGICPGDLLHMTNTVQMVKELDEPREWKPLLIRHQHYVQRTYYPALSSRDRSGTKRKRESIGCSTVFAEDGHRCHEDKRGQNRSYASNSRLQSVDNRIQKSHCVVGNSIYPNQDNCKTQQAEGHIGALLAHNEIFVKELQ